MFGVLPSALPAFIRRPVVEQFCEVLQGIGADPKVLDRAVLGYDPSLWLVAVASAGPIARSRPATASERAVLAGIASAPCLAPVWGLAIYLPSFVSAAAAARAVVLPPSRCRDAAKG